MSVATEHQQRQLDRRQRRIVAYNKARAALAEAEKGHGRAEADLAKLAVGRLFDEADDSQVRAAEARLDAAERDLRTARIAFGQTRVDLPPAR